MVRTAAEDLRVQKTLDIIRGTFDEMLCEMDYRKITVKELCERARINRKTFYRYYETMDDLLAEVKDEFAGTWMDQTSDLDLLQDAGQLAYDYCMYSAGQSDGYDAIVKDDGHRALRNELFARVQSSRRIDAAHTNEEQSAEMSLASAAARRIMTAIYQQWLEDGKRVPPETMADIARTITAYGLEGFRERYGQDESLSPESR